MGERTRIVTAARVALLVALTPAAVMVAGCGGDADKPKPVAAKPLGEVLGGSVAPLAQCADWTGGSVPRKLATIEDIRAQQNRDDSGVDSPPLSDDEAMKLFDRACKPTYSQGFRLYVIYARAAGFGPLLRQMQG